MKKFIDITDCYGSTRKFDLDTLSCIDGVYVDSGTVNLWFGGQQITVSEAEFKRVESYFETEKCDSTYTNRQEPVFIPKPDFVGLDKYYVKSQIYNADFLDAESKLKLIMLLQL